MTHHITDEQIDELCLSLTGTYTRKERDRAVARAVLALAAPAPAVPSDVLSEMREFGNARMAEFMGAHHMALVLSQKINEWADKLTAAPTAPAQPVDLLERCAQWCDEQPKSNWWGRTASDMVRAFAATTTTATPAVPEDVARVNEQMLEALKASRAYIARYGYTGKQLEIIDAAIDAARAAEKGGE